MPQEPERDAFGDVVITKTDRFCSRIDPARLAKAIGATSLTASSTGETLMTGGVGPASHGCSLRERTDSYSGFDVGVSIEAANALEEKDDLDRFEWERYELLGKPARIGVAVDSLHVQIVVKGVRLHADLGHDTIPPLELEKRLLAATEYFIELLPADATTLLR